MFGKSNKMLVEAGMSIAIAFVLHLITLFQMPQGGAITAAHLAPLLFFAFRWGGKAGMVVGLVYGLVEFILGFKFTVHIGSIILDYGLGYMMVGIAGFFKDSRLGLVMGTSLACFLRFIMSLLSGALIFGSYAPEGTNPWVYSLIYNATYMVPDYVVTIVVLLCMYSPIKRGLSKIK